MLYLSYFVVLESILKPFLVLQGFQVHSTFILLDRFRLLLWIGRYSLLLRYYLCAWLEWWQKLHTEGRRESFWIYDFVCFCLFPIGGRTIVKSTRSPTLLFEDTIELRRGVWVPMVLLESHVFLLKGFRYLFVLVILEWVTTRGIELALRGFPIIVNKHLVNKAGVKGAGSFPEGSNTAILGLGTQHLCQAIFDFRELLWGSFPLVVYELRKLLVFVCLPLRFLPEIWYNFIPIFLAKWHLVARLVQLLFNAARLPTQRCDFTTMTINVVS